MAPLYLSYRSSQNLALPSPLWPKNTPRSWHLPFLSKLSSAPAWLPWDEMQTIRHTRGLSSKKFDQKLGRKDTRGWKHNGYTFRRKKLSPASPIIFPPWIDGPPWPHGWIVSPSAVVATSVQPDGWIDISNFPSQRTVMKRCKSWLVYVDPMSEQRNFIITTVGLGLMKWRKSWLIHTVGGSEIRK